MRRAIIALAALPILAGCGDGSSYSDDQPVSEEAAYDAASDELSSQAFTDVGDTSLCTDDCGGHDAGFEWAKENDITDGSDCGGDSQSFIEGCEAYAEALEDEASEYQSEGDY